ncbi:MAG: hypothetical protein GX811_02185 [Lentisphaerae bacterium]|nr:hypothetical protein [Lentisphaerota bacterium]
MDTLTHALSGAALFSRTGLLGGKKGAIPTKNRMLSVFDWTTGSAFFFGLFPDIISIGPHFVYSLLFDNSMGFQAVPDFVFTIYKYTHSLLIASALILLVSLFNRTFALTMLAWPFHIVTDMFTHAPGPFGTRVFYPISDFAFPGSDWWKNGYLTTLPILIMIVVWIFILWYRIAKSPFSDDQNLISER